MSQSENVAASRYTLMRRLTEARAMTDEFFHLLTSESLYDRPIPERHRFIFYLGHLEAFDWNLIGGHGLNEGPIHPTFDQLFAFGIDPVDGRLPADQASDWPREATVRQYNNQVRQTLDARLAQISFADAQRPLLQDGYVLHVAIEHRLMHLETLAYMLHQLPLESKLKPPQTELECATERVSPYRIEIPAGQATLGRTRDDQTSFGWDNEYEEHVVQVPAFRIDAFNVTQGEFLEFHRAGGYEERSLWTDADWEWKSKQGIRHPVFWTKVGDAWGYRAMFREIPLPLNWPVYVSQAEASAYARWKKASLPTEAQWHRAACGTPQRKEHKFPWGDEPPDATRGNMNFVRWDVTNVGASPAGNSAWGVADLVGNGWEWTSTIFAPFPGFEKFSFYPGYSQNFFDGLHYVVKGGSPRTAPCFLRRSFRNWFQPHYPYVYATFRCVENEP